MMSKELLALYDKCLEHNISIELEYALSDACIAVTGKSLIYEGGAVGYVPVAITKLVSIHAMREVEDSVDLISLAIDEIFNKILSKREEEDA